MVEHYNHYSKKAKLLLIKIAKLSSLVHYRIHEHDNQFVTNVRKTIRGWEPEYIPPDQMKDLRVNINDIRQHYEDLLDAAICMELISGRTVMETAINYNVAFSDIEKIIHKNKLVLENLKPVTKEQ